MIRDERVLLAVLIGAVLLAILVLALFFARRGGEDYGVDDSPRGVLQNYLIAVRKGDYDRAYRYVAYLVPASQSAHGYAVPDIASFRRFFVEDNREPLREIKVEIGQEVYLDGGAVARIDLVTTSGKNRQAQSARLVKENGSWKLIGGPYPFWSYGWTADFSGSALPSPPSSAPTP